jgi:guanine nucleotide-binding protein subunit alpha
MLKKCKILLSSKKKNHQQIESYLKKEKEAYKKLQMENKVLVLGSSDSGKSTLLKQLRLSFGEPFTRQEIEEATDIIYLRIKEALNMIFTDLSLNRNFVNCYSAIRTYEGRFCYASLPEEVQNLLLKLVEDSEYLKIINQIPTIFPENALFYLSNLPNYMKPDYRATDQG